MNRETSLNDYYDGISVCHFFFLSFSLVPRRFYKDLHLCPEGNHTNNKTIYEFVLGIETDQLPNGN